MMTAKPLVLFLALVCPALYGAETRNVDKKLPLRADGVVTLESHNGTIQVQTWDRPEIEIHARIEAASSSSEDVRRFEETKVEIDGSPGSVRIKSKFPEEFFRSFWSGCNPQIHYTITAPRTARWRIRNHNASTEMRNINAALDIDTHNGTLRVANLAGPLELTMHNGKAEVEFSSFTASSRVEMHNGSVELTLPQASRFDLHASTHRGRVQSDFSILTRSSSRWGGGMDGSVNGGGPPLRLSAHNGQFRLRAR